MNYYVKADRYLLEDGERTSGYLQIEDGRFGSFCEEVSQDYPIEDWSGFTVAPGLFDTHIHGISGADVMDGQSTSIHRISKNIVQNGVTRFLPTTLTSSLEDLEASIVAINEAVHEGLSGAQFEGIFLEGPHFTEKHKGAQNPDYFTDPDYDAFQKLYRLSNGSIRKIALAPEREGAFEFIKKVSSDGIHVGIAHTDASYECCNEAVRAGATIYVHLFNGMKGLHHRDPGVVGAALIDNAAFTEMICDGQHVHPDVAKLVLSIKKDHLVLVTDCMSAGMMPDGAYLLGEFRVNVENGIARTATGSLAGSTLRLIDGVKHLYEWGKAPLHEVWHLASLSPAKSVGLSSNLGSIQKGKAADYVVINDKLEIEFVAIDGTANFRRKINR